MAKIYETHKDLERDVLKDQAKHLHYQSAVESGISGTSIILGLALNMWNAGREKASRVLSALSTAGFIAGIGLEIHSWMTKGKARDTERELERLGPGQVVLPPETVESSADLSRILKKGPRGPLAHAEAEKGCDCPLQR